MNEFRSLPVDKKLVLHWRQYILQSLFATVAIFVVILLLELEHTVMVASIGATVFIVFAMPKSITARPRSIIGGHMVGLISGSLFALIPHSSMLVSAVVYALAVGCAVLLMVVTDTEHPPAAGTALGVAIAGFSLSVLLSVLTSVVVLALIHFFLRSHLTDLV